jgi:hypothetical protein
MIQCLLAADSFGRVEKEKLGEKIDRQRVGVREERRERNTGLDGQGTNVVLGLNR